MIHDPDLQVKSVPGVKPAVVVMGPSGSGKSTLGRALAERLDVPFVEGDALHPPANVAKMRAGIALSDADREPFLDAVARTLRAAGPGGVVLSCSALKRRYRDLIRERAGAVRFVLPLLEREDLLTRVARRPDHFMPVSLVASQLADLELPEPGEGVILVAGNAPTVAQVDEVIVALRGHVGEDVSG